MCVCYGMNVRMCMGTHVFRYICVSVCGGQRLTLGALALFTEAGVLTRAHNSSSFQLSSPRQFALTLPSLSSEGWAYGKTFKPTQLSTVIT